MLSRPAFRDPARLAAVITVVIAVLATVACSGPTPRTHPRQQGPGITGISTNSSLGPGQSQAVAWGTYDDNAARSGIDTSSPVAGKVSPAWKAKMSGKVYAQPLIASGKVIVADESDTLTALDAKTGAIVWKRHLGTPVPADALPCGNIDPSGVTGTPVIDTVTSVIWVVALLLADPTSITSKSTLSSTTTSPSTSSSSSSSTSPATGGTSSSTSSTIQTSLTGIHHELFSLNLSTGTILSQRDVDPAGSNPLNQQQRGALTIAGGYLYIPFGGLFGDCGSYRGYVVGVPLVGSAPRIQFETDAYNQAGIWYPAGPVLTSGGNLLVATGNGQSANGGPAPTSQDANSVILLSSQLSVIGSFTPSNAPALSAADLDLGSTNPVLVPHNLVFIAGKNGVGYLLSMPHLGGVGGAKFAASVCPSGGHAMGGSVYYKENIFVSCTNGLVALALAGDSFSVAWTVGNSLMGPPIVSGGKIWSVGIDTDSLQEIDPSTGLVVNDFTIGPPVHFESPAAGGGRLYVYGKDQIQAFSWK